MTRYYAVEEHSFLHFIANYNLVLILLHANGFIGMTGLEKLQINVAFYIDLLNSPLNYSCISVVSSCH